MRAVKKGRKISAMTQTALAKPPVSLSRNRSDRIEKRTMRYATKANDTMMNQMMSQKLIWWHTSSGRALSVSRAFEPPNELPMHVGGTPEPAFWIGEVVIDRPTCRVDD